MMLGMLRELTDAIKANPDDFAVACEIETPIGRVFVDGAGYANSMSRIGERRNGVVVSTAHLSDREIAAAGLSNRVRPAPDEANRLYG